MRKHQLIKRLRQLKWVELFNVFWMPAGVYIIATNIGASPGTVFWMAACCNSFLLLQGSVFWFVIDHQVQTGESLSMTNLFAVLKWLDRLLIAFCLLYFPFQEYESNTEVYCVIFFLVLFLLEYLNYFEVQLMYDNQADKNYLKRYRRLKTAKLKQIITGSTVRRINGN